VAVNEQASIPETLKPGSFAHPDQAKPLMKMVRSMFKGKMKGKLGKGVRKKGFTTGDIHVKQKKVKFY